MWRCKNGRPNYAKEFSLHARCGRELVRYHNIALLPCLELRPWDRSCLASNETLGTIYHSVHVSLRWWKLGCEVGFARSIHAKTQAEVDQAMEGRR